MVNGGWVATLASNGCVAISYRDVHGLGGNAALVGIVTGHHDVAVLTPGRAPAVLEEPVIAPVLSPIADHQQGVSELGARAARLTVHTIRVELKRQSIFISGTYKML